MTAHRTRTVLVALLALLWTMLILGLYYLVHKPVTTPLAEALGAALLDLLTMAVFALAAGGLGRFAVQRVDLAPWTLPERIAGHALIGLSLLALLIFLVGALALTPLSISLLLLAVFTLAWRQTLTWAWDVLRWLRRGTPREGWPRFAALAVLLMLALALIMALLPPTTWDALTYHLAGPAQYVAHGRFYAAPHNHFLGFPQLVDTLYAGQLALSGRLTGSALLHWLIGALTLLMAGGYAARRSGPRAGWLAAAVLLVAKTVWLEMSFAYADLLAIGLAVVALALAERWQTLREAAARGHGSPVGTAPGPGERGAGVRPPPGGVRAPFRAGLGALLLLGVAVGCAMSTKYTAIWLGVAVGVLVLWLARRDGWRHALGFGAVYAVTAALVVAPWLIRNLVWYDNPVYPFFFESAEMDRIHQDWYSRPGSGLINSDNAWHLPVFPITATFLGVEGGELYSTDIGPLFLILAPLVLLTWATLERAERRTAARGLLVSGAIAALWVISAAFGSYANIQTRLVLYLFGPLAVVCGIVFAALRRLPKRPFDLGFVLQALVTLTLLFMLVDGLVTFANSGVSIYFSGEAGYEQAYLEHALGWHYATLEDVNQRLPAGATVRLLWEPRYLYCDDTKLTCYTDSLMDSWYHARRTVADGDPAAIGDAWRDTADYLLVYEFGRGFEKDRVDLYTPDDWAAWDAFAATYLDEIQRYGRAGEAPQYILYAWRR